MSNKPTVAYVVLDSGEKINCLLEKVGKREWQAVPVKNVDFMDVDKVFVDVIPGKSRVTFVTRFVDDDDQSTD